MFSILLATALAATDPSPGEQIDLLQACNTGSIEACRTLVGTTLRAQNRGATDQSATLAGTLDHACELGDGLSCFVLGDHDRGCGVGHEPSCTAIVVQQSSVAACAAGHGPSCATLHAAGMRPGRRPQRVAFPTVPSMNDGRPVVVLPAPPLRTPSSYRAESRGHTIPGWWSVDGRLTGASVEGWALCPQADAPVMDGITWALLADRGCTAADARYGLARVDLERRTATQEGGPWVDRPVIFDADAERALVQLGGELVLTDRRHPVEPGAYDRAWLLDQAVVTQRGSRFAIHSASGRNTLEVSAVLATDRHSRLAVRTDHLRVIDTRGKPYLSADIRPTRARFDRRGDLFVDSDGGLLLPLGSAPAPVPTAPAPHPPALPMAPPAPAAVGATLKGVVLSGGRPLANSMVWAQPASPELRHPSRFAATDRRGRFEFTQLPYAAVVVGITHGDKVALQTVDTRQPDDLRLTLQPATKVSIPVEAGTRVRLGDGAWFVDAEIADDTASAWLPTEVVRAGFVAEQHHPDGVSTALLRSDLDAPVLTIPAGEPLTIQVIDALSRPVVGAPVSLRPALPVPTAVLYTDVLGRAEAPGFTMTEAIPDVPDGTCVRDDTGWTCTTTATSSHVQLSSPGWYWSDGDASWAEPGWWPRPTGERLYGWFDGGLHEAPLSPHHAVPEPWTRVGAACAPLLDVHGVPLARAEVQLTLADEGGAVHPLRVQTAADGSLCIPNRAQAVLDPPLGTSTLANLQMASSTTPPEPERLPPSKLKVESWMDQVWFEGDRPSALPPAVERWSPGVFVVLDTAAPRPPLLTWQGRKERTWRHLGGEPHHEVVGRIIVPSIDERIATAQRMPAHPGVAGAWLPDAISLWATGRTVDASLPLKGPALLETMDAVVRHACPQAQDLALRASLDPTDRALRAAAYRACGSTLPPATLKTLPLPTGLLADAIAPGAQAELVPVLVDPDAARHTYGPWLDSIDTIDLPITHDPTATGAFTGCALRVDARGRAKPVREPSASCDEGTLVLADAGGPALSLVRLAGADVQLAVRGPSALTAFEAVTAYPLAPAGEPAQATLSLTERDWVWTDSASTTGTLGELGLALLRGRDAASVEVRVSESVRVQLLAEVLHALQGRAVSLAPLDSLEGMSTDGPRVHLSVYGGDGLDVAYHVADAEAALLACSAPSPTRLDVARFDMLTDGHGRLRAYPRQQWTSDPVAACFATVLEGLQGPRSAHHDFRVDVSVAR